MTEELCRLNQNKTGEQPADLSTTLLVDLGDQSEQTYDRIIQIVGLLAKYGTYWGSRSQLSWPSDQEWLSLLPQWFLASFKNHSKEQYKKMMADMPKERWGELPWLFGSWTASMKERVWEWWSCKRHDRMLEIHLLLEGWPCSIGALEYLVKVAGACSIELIEDDHM